MPGVLRGDFHSRFRLLASAAAPERGDHSESPLRLLASAPPPLEVGNHYSLAVFFLGVSVSQS